MIVSIIRLIHLIIVGLISISPFLDFEIIKRYSFIFLIYLLFQYISGYQKCGLTRFEYMIMGEKYKEGFLYRLINPMISVREDYFEKYLVIVHCIYIIILFIQLYNIENIIDIVYNYLYFPIIDNNNNITKN